jgi:hypothetical protein
MGNAEFKAAACLSPFPQEMMPAPFSSSGFDQK